MGILCRIPLAVNHEYRQQQQSDLRFRRTRSNTANGLAGSATVSPTPFPHKRGSVTPGEEGDEKVRTCFYFFISARINAVASSTAVHIGITRPCIASNRASPTIFLANLCNTLQGFMLHSGRVHSYCCCRSFVFENLRIVPTRCKWVKQSSVRAGWCGVGHLAVCTEAQKCSVDRHISVTFREFNSLCPVFSAAHPRSVQSGRGKGCTLPGAFQNVSTNPSRRCAPIRNIRASLAPNYCLCLLPSMPACVHLLLSDNQTRNETIEGMVAAHREHESRMAKLKLGELGQVRFPWK